MQVVGRMVKRGQIDEMVVETAHNAPHGLVAVGNNSAPLQRTRENLNRRGQSVVLRLSARRDPNSEVGRYLLFEIRACVAADIGERRCQWPGDQPTVNESVVQRVRLPDRRGRLLVLSLRGS